MNHYRIVGAALIAFSATSGAALAADVGAPAIYVPPPALPEAPSVVETFTWAGPYVGATVGYAWGEADGDAPLGGDFDVEGYTAGAFAGYNADMGGFVLGAEADANWAGIEGTNGGVTGEIDALYSVRGRAGVDLGRVLVYGTGGLAIGSGHLTAVGLDETNTHYGWTAGAGVDVAVTDNVFGRIEYRHTDLGSETYGAAGDVNLDADIVSAGIGIRF